MDLATRALVNSVGLLIFGSMLTFLAARYWFQRNVALALAKDAEIKAKAIADEHTKVLVRLGELEGKLALVNQAIIPISTAFQAILIKELTHYHTPELDALLQKIGPPNTLTPDEEARMAFLLDERTRDMGPEISESERDAAHILPMIIKRARAEAETLSAAEEMKVKLVTVAAVLGVPNIMSVEGEPPHPFSILAKVGPPNRRSSDKDPAVEGNTEVLKKIEQNTAESAAAMTNLNIATSEKLAREIVNKKPKE